MSLRPCVNYDTIAHLYDSRPYREKTVDPELLAFVAQRAPMAVLSILDVGCGTGNQVVANRTVVPSARWVARDQSLGMLRQAQPKVPDLAWIQADSATLPLQAQSFDFITCQYAFHHVQDKAGMLREVLRVRRPGCSLRSRRAAAGKRAGRGAHFPGAHGSSLFRHHSGREVDRLCLTYHRRAFCTGCWTQ